VNTPGSTRRTRDRFLVFGAPAIEEPEIDEVVATLRSGWLGTGPRVAAFETAFRAYKDAPHAVAVNSCTAALHLSLVALGLEPGDEVITSGLTFCSTVNAIVHAGARPVIADVDPATMCLDLADVERRITERTRALVPVHFGGRPCEMDELMALAGRRGLKVVEDCAHAIETLYRGRCAGTIGDFGCFSFYVTKNVVTGEGGMIVTASEDDAAHIKTLALHGMTKDAWNRFSDDGYKHYLVVAAGFKYNMMDIQAALGLHQLQRVEENWKRRQEIWRTYDAAFAALPIGLPPPPAPDTRHAYHLYTILVDEGRAGLGRDAFLDSMTRLNIGVGVHYLAIPEHPYYREVHGLKAEECPHAVRIGRETVSLPLSPKLGDDDVEDVIAAVHRALGRNA